jgi:acetamidase/formamidase
MPRSRIRPRIEWGWAGLIPHFGLLSDDFPEPLLAHARTADRSVVLDFGVTLPSLPMVGTMGVALPEPGRHPLLPPSRYGGNMDIRQLGLGAAVTFPVGVSGALLSMGDAHSTMGDGEVCGTGVETSARVTVEVHLVKGRAPAFPVLQTPASSRREGPALVTTGIGPDLLAAARDATRAMIDEVARRTTLAPETAYILTSLAADLAISEIVDVPNFVVSLHLPMSLLG